MRLGLGLGLQRRGGRALVHTVYGVRFRDAVTDFEYERTGSLDELGYDATDEVNEEHLQVHNKLQRCVVKDDGTFNYYLHPDNSAYKQGSSIPDSLAGMEEIETIKEEWDDAYDTGRIGLIKLKPDSSPAEAAAEANIGKWIEVFDAVSSKGGALIVGWDNATKEYLLSHPHHKSWGGGATHYRIGDAKLDGSDGQVMVEIPEFWHKYSLENDGGHTWQKHEVSLSEFDGATKFVKRYISAFEGVRQHDSKHRDGWIGTYNSETKRWADSSQHGSVDRVGSVAGFYPLSTYHRANFRAACDGVSATPSYPAASGYHQYDFRSNWILQLLIVIEVASFNSQDKVGDGLSSVSSGQWNNYNSYRGLRKTGDSIRAGNSTFDQTELGINAPKMDIDTQDYTIETVSYRGVENMWGHLWKWLDGINLRWDETVGENQFARPSICEKPEHFQDDVNSGEYAEVDERMVSNVWIAASATCDITEGGEVSTDGGNFTNSRVGTNMVVGGIEYEIESITDNNNLTLKDYVGGVQLGVVCSYGIFGSRVQRYWRIPGSLMFPVEPNAETGGATSFMCDYLYLPSSVSVGYYRAVLVGGNALSGAIVGAWCVLSSLGWTYSLARSGGRLCKKNII